MTRLHCRILIVGLTLSIVTINIRLVESQSIWPKEPSALVQVEIGSSAVLEWNYDLNGQAIYFAKWGKAMHDGTWDQSYIMRGKGDSKAEVVAVFASKVQWIANATMVIINASLSDSGKYGCSIDLANSQMMKSYIELEVLQLTKVNQSGNQLLKPSEGSMLSLHFYTLANHQPTVFWLKDGVQLKQNPNFNYTVEVIANQSSQSLYRFSLLKQFAHKDDSGLYQGLVKFFGKSVLIRNFTLIVRYSPKNSTRFYTSTGSDILLEGSNASLICEADSYPAPTYDIRKFSTSLSNSTVKYHAITNANRKDEGIYFCTPRNEIGDGRAKSIGIQIGSAPLIRSASVKNYVAYGESIILQCTITAWPIPSTTWLKDGGSLRSNHKVRNITNIKEVVSEVEISKAEFADIGNYSCNAENMFDRRSININLAVLMFVWPNISSQKEKTFIEGSNFSISYDIQANIQPNVSWFKDDQRILSGFNTPVEFAGTEANLTIYRIKITKNNLKSEDSGIYHAKMMFGSIEYNLTSFSMKVQALKSTQEQQQDADFDTWMIPIIIGMASILLLAVAVFCGVLAGRRYHRAPDPERNSNDIQQPNKSSMRSGNGQSVTAKLRNGINNVAFEGESRERTEAKEDGSAEDTNTDFNRDSIYRFTVNPMFSSPEEEHQSDNDDQFLPFRHAMYFPTNAAYETTQAEIAFGSEYDIEEQYLSSPPNTDEDIFDDTVTNPDDVQIETSSTLPSVPESDALDSSDTPEVEVAENEGAVEPEDDEIEEEAAVPQHGVDEDASAGAEMEENSPDEESILESGATDHRSENYESALNESWNLKLDASKFEKSTSSFDMYISEIFDFRTSNSS